MKEYNPARCRELLAERVLLKERSHPFTFGEALVLSTQELADQLEAAMAEIEKWRGHTHEWRKTGEGHPTNPPIWFWVCDECRAVGKAKDGEPVRVDGVWTEEEYRKWGGVKP